MGDRMFSPCYSKRNSTDKPLNLIFNNLVVFMLLNPLESMLINMSHAYTIKIIQQCIGHDRLYYHNLKSFNTALYFIIVNM